MAEGTVSYLGNTAGLGLVAPHRFRRRIGSSATAAPAPTSHASSPSRVVGCTAGRPQRRVRFRIPEKSRTARKQELWLEGRSSTREHFQATHIEACVRQSLRRAQAREAGARGSAPQLHERSYTALVRSRRRQTRRQRRPLAAVIKGIAPGWLLRCGLMENPLRPQFNLIAIHVRPVSSGEVITSSFTATTGQRLGAREYCVPVMTQAALLNRSSTSWQGASERLGCVDPKYGCGCLAVVDPAAHDDLALEVEAVALRQLCRISRRE